VLTLEVLSLEKYPPPPRHTEGILYKPRVAGGMRKFKILGDQMFMNDLSNEIENKGSEIKVLYI
jgi:hypothetical protein